MTSVRRHFGNQPNSNLSCVEELLDKPQAKRQKDPSVTSLRSQLALEYRLQSLCQRLLESYKDQNDWAAVGQVAQSLVTNSQRVSLLKERLLSGNYSYLSPPSHRLQNITELSSGFRTASDSRGGSLLVSEADDETREAIDTDTESGSESSTASSLSKAKTAKLIQCLDSRGDRDIPDTTIRGDTSGSGGDSSASSAVDYETASQQTTSESEPETGSTGLDTSAPNSGPESSNIDQLLRSASTTPSPVHCSSGCSEECGHSTEPVDIHIPQQPAVTAEDDSQPPSVVQQEEPSAASSPSDEEEKEEHTPGGELKAVESVMETVSEDLAGGTDVGSFGTVVVGNSNGEVCVGGAEVEVHVTTAEGEGAETRGEQNEVGGDNCGSNQTHRENGSAFSGDAAFTVDGCRVHSNSCPQDEPIGAQITSKMSSQRLMSLSGSDSNLNVSYSEPHKHQTLDDSSLLVAVTMNMDKSASSEDLEMSLPSSTRVNRKRQATIPGFVSRQTRGLRKSTHKLVKRMGSMKLGRIGRSSLDATGNTLAVMPPAPIRGQDWDPTCLLEELYGDYKRVARSSTVENARHCGYLEKLPVDQAKKNILKGYKRRYFRAIEGNLYYYEDRLSERALGFLKLEDCKLAIIPEKLQLCLTECNGKILVMRAPNHNHVELSDWHRALQLESVHPTHVIMGSTMEENPVIIMDIGACSVRVGLAGEDAYPELFFPSVCSVDTCTEECNDCGLGALLPENRIGAKLVYPRRSTAQMSRNSTTINQAIVDIVDTVLNHYDLQAYQCSLVMTVPHTVPEEERAELAEALLSTVFQFQSILFQEQAILSLYSYNTTTGVVVDIGDHIDIFPVIDGYPIEGAINRLPYGGNAITEYLTKLLTAKGIRYFSETETYINRYIKEDACVVSLNYVQDCEACESKPALYSHQINVDRFQLPDHRKAIVVDDARFKATEGLFTPGLWGKDVTGLHDLVWKSIQACPIDHRKLLLRNIFLSGGSSLLPGLQERLKAEISTLAPTGSTVEVHASENRQHAAFLGAAILTRLTSFSQSVITQEEWNSKGRDALNKWSS